ncbi:MAG: hypothetical protein KGI54_14115 [Pseudomonadota bacterium]|nr:hypothetical protein [Pseudomonadota bacterium]
MSADSVPERLARVETNVEHMAKDFSDYKDYTRQIASSMQQMALTLSELDHHRTNISALKEKVENNTDDINKLEKRVSTIEYNDDQEAKGTIKTWKSRAWEISVWIVGLIILIILAHFGIHAYG